MYLTKCRGGSSPGDPERDNAMYTNNGDGTFTENAEAIGMKDNAQSWATVFEDFDNDGDFDAFIVNHDFQNRLMVNDGNGNFTDVIETSGINPTDLGAWENQAADFNNDGFVDIFSEMSKELYINNGDMTFTGMDLPFDEGAIADLNNDGFLDIVNDGQLWINEGNSNNNWVKVILKGTDSNLNGIGARVDIFGTWGKQMREVRSGQGFSHMSSLTAHFGIGTSTEIDKITIT
ncbi:MAG TPA: RNA-binding protein, partial [Flavobacteriaceae bacterium]|nr:RNA-binding protein [Flavobacteriaceae bacterium]